MNTSRPKSAILHRTAANLRLPCTSISHSEWRIAMKPLRAVGSWLAITFGSLFIAAAFNLLMIPQELLSGGISGISLMIGYLTGSSIAWLYFALNIPVLIWGWFTLGRRFVGWSFYSVLATTLLLKVIPVIPLPKGHSAGRRLRRNPARFRNRTMPASRRLFRRLRYRCLHREPQTRLAHRNADFCS